MRALTYYQSHCHKDVIHPDDPAGKACAAIDKVFPSGLDFISMDWKGAGRMTSEQYLNFHPHESRYLFSLYLGYDDAHCGEEWDDFARGYLVTFYLYDPAREWYGMAVIKESVKFKNMEELTNKRALQERLFKSIGAKLQSRVPIH